MAGLAGPPAVAAPVQPVETGIYLMNLYDLDIDAHSFYADFYLWFRWRGERDPMQIEFVNAVEKWGFTREDFHEEPLVLEDGSYYNGMRIEGRFFHPFQLSQFPLDRHDLQIWIENIVYPVDSLVYRPDTVTQLIRPDLDIPGWRLREAALVTRTNRYGTDFGERGVVASNFSDLGFQVEIQRPLAYFFLKLLLPLFIVLLAGLGALMIHPSYLEARVSLPVGALLSCVFLQQAYDSALPDIGYMVLMDQIYLVAYLLIALIILRVVLTGNRSAEAASPDWAAVRRSDRKRAWIYLGGFCLMVGLLVLLA
jgi:hypothetical protein